MSQLISKITKAALDVGGVLKADAKNKDQNYDYISSDKILTICGQALFNNGVAVIPTVVMQTTAKVDYTNSRGQPGTRYDSQVDFLFHISDGEETFDAAWSGAGNDYAVPDKALYKAITSGHKYFLMKLLCIGEGNEDGEHESKPEQPAKAVQPPAPAIEYPEHLAVVKDRNGVRYVDIGSDKLPFMANSIKKASEKPGITEDEKAEYAMKFDTISQILELRGMK